MDELLHRFFWKVGVCFSTWIFSTYIVKIPEVKGSFYVLIKKPRRKILGDNLKNLLDKVKQISEKERNKFAEDYNTFQYNYFRHFKLVKYYGNYQYHFLAIRKDYQYE